MEKDPFESYQREGDASKQERSYVWRTAVGLQKVDGLSPSKYLYDIAIDNIEGDLSFDEARKLINSYYEKKLESTSNATNVERIEEADKVSVRIAHILSENAFTFSPTQYLGIHRQLFQDILEHAGMVREYNITKKEWVLDEETVIYGDASHLKETLEYDFALEKNFNYKGLTLDEVIHHLAVFISRLWQIHIFEEGNTRTTAVFLIKYARTLGFKATNDIFADNSWYFRNALVRANYTDVHDGIYETTEYLELFLRNMLLNESNELNNRNLHVRSKSI
ncbi:cell filamentation protein Fic [Alloscardovia theropitheci]|uniref:protein adenylyltransferase n=1 Tax=Alloscardovia theropitheci TaxID=2496842 RepID=A0A4R0QYM7_9BIFI|nr:Fic family protein [Alloscardovia theropitheci]TCD53596.1 cell filamentation protein Fic [Alloscardovia theropitheci]